MGYRLYGLTTTCIRFVFFKHLWTSSINFQVPFNIWLTYHKEARVGVDHLGLVSGLQIPKDRRVVEEGQVDHVLALLKLWGVDTTNVTSLEPAEYESHPEGSAIFQLT